MPDATGVAVLHHAITVTTNQETPGNMDLAMMADFQTQIVQHVLSMARAGKGGVQRM